MTAVKIIEEEMMMKNNLDHLPDDSSPRCPTLILTLSVI